MPPLQTCAQLRREKKRQALLAIEKTKRIRILNAEVDVLRSAANDRSRTIETKASYIVLAAGVLASIAGASLVIPETWLVGLVPFALTIAAVVVATVALWPRKIRLPSAREVVNRWVDDDSVTAEQLEDNVLEVKTKEVTFRNELNEKRSVLTNWGFSLLIAGLATTMLVVVLNTLSPYWSTHDEAKPKPAPSSVSAQATGPS